MTCLSGQRFFKRVLLFQPEKAQEEIVEKYMLTWVSFSFPEIFKDTYNNNAFFSFLNFWIYI